MNHTRKSGGSNLVYTTGQGRICPDCRKAVANCSCRQTSTPPVTDSIVRIRRETKGRAGKGVTVITGVPLGPADLDQLARQLKQRCGTGGTVKNGMIEIQGDHRDLLLAELAKKGWTVKKAGG